MSNPHPRLAMDAGANTLTVFIGSGYLLSSGKTGHLPGSVANIVKLFKKSHPAATFGNYHEKTLSLERIASYPHHEKASQNS